MADLKISQLPEATTLGVTDILPAVNSGITRKINLQNLSNALPLTTFVKNASGSWGGGVSIAGYSFAGPYIPITDNLFNSTDNYPRWNTELFNTDANTYEFFNAGSTLSRVFIKTAGYYEITTAIHYYDLFNNMRMTVKLFNGTTSTGPMTQLTQIANRYFIGAVNPPGQTIDSTLIFFNSSPTYYTVGLFPTANSPYPSSENSTPSRFFLKKILPA